MRVNRFALLLISGLLLSSCSTLHSNSSLEKDIRLSFVSIGNMYVDPASGASVRPIDWDIRQFNRAVMSAAPRRAVISSLVGKNIALSDITSLAMRHDSPTTVTVLFIATHGERDGLLFSRLITFEELYSALDREMKGIVILVLESCYSGGMNKVLEGHLSTHVFSLTSTKSEERERWYESNGNFTQAVTNALRNGYSEQTRGQTTLGCLYRAVQADIARWNRQTTLIGFPLQDAGMFGPEEQVVLDSN